MGSISFSMHSFSPPAEVIAVVVMSSSHQNHENGNEPVYRVVKIRWRKAKVQAKSRQSFAL
jgi:hypothetical protein